MIFGYEFDNERLKMLAEKKPKSCTSPLTN